MSAIGTVVCARMQSARLPGKALLPIGGVPMVQCLLDRLRGTRLGGEVIFATTERQDDNVLAAAVAALGVPVVRGSEQDVADRCLKVARQYGLDWIVRVTGDCPFVDAESLDHCLSQWNPREASDLVSTKGVFPVGIDYELLAAATLEREWPRMSEEEREHVTLRLYRPDLYFAVRPFVPPAAWPATRDAFVVDTAADYAAAVSRRDRLGSNGFSVQQLLESSSA